MRANPPGHEGAAGPRSGERGYTRYYQLTHDYLVPSLRDWLTRKQKETRRGRAELLLADRSAVWNARPENRQLPSLLQWLQIRWLTAKRSWTVPQRRMMGKATRYHSLRAFVVAGALAPHKDDLLDKLWAVVESPLKSMELQRLRAAAALAKYDPDSERWDKVSKAVANDLVRVPAVYLVTWLDAFRPVSEPLRRPLE